MKPVPTTEREVRFTLPAKIAEMLGESDSEIAASAREAVVVALVGCARRDVFELLADHNVALLDTNEADREEIARYEDEHGG